MIVPKQKNQTLALSIQKILKICSIQERLRPDSNNKGLKPSGLAKEKKATEKQSISFDKLSESNTQTWMVQQEGGDKGCGLTPKGSLNRILPAK